MELEKVSFCHLPCGLPWERGLDVPVSLIKGEAEAWRRGQYSEVLPNAPLPP